MHQFRIKVLKLKAKTQTEACRLDTVFAVIAHVIYDHAGVLFDLEARAGAVRGRIT